MFPGFYSAVLALLPRVASFITTTSLSEHDLSKSTQLEDTVQFQQHQPPKADYYEVYKVREYSIDTVDMASYSDEIPPRSP